MSSTSSDSFRTYNRALLVLGLSLGVAVGCDTCCAEEIVKPVDTVGACEVLDCKDGTDFRYGSCVQGGCSVDADCCPGTRCRSDLNICFPRLLDSEFSCETSDDCPDPAQVCATVSIGGREALPTCIYESCAGDDDCGSFRTCYAGHCVINTPCNGSCPQGSVCEVNSNSCHELPTNLPGKAADNAKSIADSCKQECPNGLVVLKDEGAMTGEVCCELDCECLTAPSIVPSRFGHYPRVAVGPSEVLVSAYEADFGDLVVVRFNTSGEQSRIDFVDGVPGGTPTNDPNGARGGIRDPGPNVGTHTSIAVNSAGLARVAYHDVDNNALKVAIETSTGVWTSHFVDGASNAAVGQTGTFTDVAVAADGTIFVSYLAHNTTIAGVTGAATGVKLARSKTPTPTSAADWDLFTLDSAPFVASGDQREESPEMPRGRGLHTSIILDGTAALVAYYDNTAGGDVRVAKLAGSTVSVSVVDGDAQGGRVGGDVGRYPTLGLTGSDLLIAYEDTARHAVRYWKGPKDTPGTGGAYGVADQLRNEDRSGSRFIGAGARMSTEGSRPILVHQDASNLDLRVGTFDGGAWSNETLVGQGANGFYADVSVSAGKAYICSVVAELDARGKERSRLRLDIKNLP